MNEVDILSDPRIQQVGSLLSRMTSSTDDTPKFNRAQVASWIEVAIPRTITSMPTMPAGMSCDIQKPDEDTWVLTITRPKS